jgi:hypothetical protein
MYYQQVIEGKYRNEFILIIDIITLAASNRAEPGTQHENKLIIFKEKTFSTFKKKWKEKSFWRIIDFCVKR